MRRVLIGHAKPYGTDRSSDELYSRNVPSHFEGCDELEPAGGGFSACTFYNYVRTVFLPSSLEKKKIWSSTYR